MRETDRQRNRERENKKDIGKEKEWDRPSGQKDWGTRKESYRKIHREIENDRQK